MSFANIQVREEIVRALQDMQITTPTDIQEKSIPLSMAGKDVIGIARTGSGKTIAFSIPILEKIVPGKKTQALIIAPTRELVVQIAREMEKFSKYMPFKVAQVFGGVSINPQMEALEECEIVVGTPGRLIDHLERGTLNLYNINTLVLDEADKMVEMGFIEDITYIIDKTPKNRQILLFGATISDEIRSIEERYMHDVEKVKVAVNVKEDLLKQYYYNIDAKDKFSLLVHLLHTEQTERVMIFCSSRRTVDMVYQNLRLQGIKAAMIHGKLTQNKRLQIINGFNEGRPKILIASAVAARGLDIKEVTHVINYDLSEDPQEYIHRIGRTARAGEAGKAITLLTHRDHSAFGAILDRYRLEVTELKPGEFPRIRFNPRLGDGQSEEKGRSGPRRGGQRGTGNFGAQRNGQGQRQGRGSQRSNNSQRPSGQGRSNRSYGGDRR